MYYYIDNSNLSAVNLGSMISYAWITTLSSYTKYVYLMRCYGNKIMSIKFKKKKIPH